MNINKIYNAYNSQQIYEKQVKTDKNKLEENVKENNLSLNKVSGEKLDISLKAKMLQETEVILRSSLDKLKEFDEIRNEKLDYIRSKIDSGFYFTSQFNEIIADKIYSEEEIDSTIQAKIEMKNYILVLNTLSDSEIVDNDKIKFLKTKVDSDFYDKSEVMEETADKLIELLS